MSGNSDSGTCSNLAARAVARIRKASGDCAEIATGQTSRTFAMASEAGASSRTTWAFVPLQPKELTPASLLAAVFHSLPLRGSDSERVPRRGIG